MNRLWLQQFQLMCPQKCCSSFLIVRRRTQLLSSLPSTSICSFIKDKPPSYSVAWLSRQVGSGQWAVDSEWARQPPKCVFFCSFMKNKPPSHSISAGWVAQSGILYRRVTPPAHLPQRFVVTVHRYKLSSTLHLLLLHLPADSVQHELQRWPLNNIHSAK